MVMAFSARGAWSRGSALVLGLVALACGPGARGAVSADGFLHNDYGYRVAASADGRVLPESWKLDNFYEADVIDAETGQTKKVVKPKDGKDYVVDYQLDYDGDGEFESKVTELTYDLRYEHLVHDGVIFLRTIPISTDLKHKKLSVLMDRYVEQIAGAGYEVVNLNSQVNILVEKRYAAAHVSKVATKLADRDAFLAILDVANLDQIKVDPKARKERVELVLLHTDFAYKQSSSNQESEPRAFPVIMFVGYANKPDEFQAGQADFHDFLRRIEIAGHRGFEPPKLEVTASTEASEPVGEAPAAAPSSPPHPDEPSKPASKPDP
jgi:hypothetical protein